MKHLLFPTDFSANARNAIDHAIQMYGDEPLKCYLLNTYYTPHTSPDAPDTTVKIIEDEMNEKFNYLVQSLQATYPSHYLELEPVFRYGDFVEIINDLVEEADIHLVVMGTQGATGLERVLIGSYTAKVIQHVKCPTLAVPAEAKYVKPEKIVFALDANQEPLGSVMEPMVEIAKKFNAEVFMLHVINGDTRRFEEHDLDQYLEGVKYKYETVYDKKVVHGIEDFIQKQQAHLLAMVTQDLNLFQQLFHKSLTKRMSMHTKVPLLALHQ